MEKANLQTDTKKRKSLGIATVLVFLLGPFGFIYLGWKNFLVATVGVIAIGAICRGCEDFVLVMIFLIFELFLLIVVWSRYRKQQKFFEIGEEIKGDKEQISGDISEQISAAQEQEPGYRNCPFCGEKILRIAKKCRYCGEFLDQEAEMAKNFVDKIKCKMKRKLTNREVLLVLLVPIMIGCYVIGRIHIITGIEGGLSIITKEHWGFSETFINVDKIVGVPWVIAIAKYPIACKTLAKRGYITDPQKEFEAKLEKLEKELKKTF